MKLTIPYIAGLDMLPLPAATAELCGKGLQVNINTVNWPEAQAAFPAEYADKRRLEIAYSDLGFYLFYREEVPALCGVNVRRQSEVSNDNCFEFFVRRKGMERYFNIEHNWHGAVNCSRRPGRRDAVKLDAGELLNFHALTSACKADGTALEIGKEYKDCGEAGRWSLSLFVPFSMFGIEKGEPGMVFEGNFYSCAAKSSVPYYFSWAPIDTPKPDYHRPEFFGELILGSEN